MTIELTHGFIKKAHDLPALLDGCVKMSTFMTRLERQAQLWPNRYSPNDYKGDGFELFVEALIKLSPVDGRIAITDYTPGDPNRDNGIDGFGISMTGKKAGVQIKYRGDSRKDLTAKEDNLNSFMTEAYLEDIEKDRANLLIVTTAKGLNHYTDHEKFRGMVRCLGIKDLRSLVDNNNLFWDSFRKLVGV